ncbi:MAG: WD40 repeat domain-containing protein, partial [Myxococcota bacterium]
SAEKRLGRALYEKARASLQRRDYMAAETLTAAALTYSDSPETRGLLLSLDRRYRPELVWLRHFGWSCNHMRFSPDGGALSCPTLSGISILNVSDGQESTRLVGGNGFVRDAYWSADGDALAGVGFDGRLRVWSVDEAKARVSVKGHGNEGLTMAYAAEHDLLVTGGADKTVICWEWDGGTPTEQWRNRDAHRHSVSAVAFNADGTRIASGDENGYLVVHDQNGEVVQQLRPHRNRITGIQFIDATGVVTVSSDKRLVATDLGTGERVFELDEHDGGVRSLYGLDGRTTVATGDELGTLRIWNLRHRRLGGRFTAHREDLLSVDFNTEGREFVTASVDGVVRVWRLPDRPEPSTLIGSDDDMRTVAWSHDGKRVAAGGRSGRVSIWDRASGTLERILWRDEREIRDVSFDSTGTFLAAASEGALPAWYDVRPSENTGPYDPKRQAQALMGSVSGTRALAVHPARNWVVTGGDDRGVRVHNLETQQTRILGKHEALVTSVAVSPMGTLIASAGRDDTVRVWSADNGKQLHRLSGHEGQVNSIRFLDEGRLASVGDDGTLHIWNTTSGEGATWEAHDGVVRGLAVDGEHDRIATSGVDHSVRLWNADTQQLIAAFESNDTVYGLDFSPDGTELAGVSDGDVVTIWSLQRLGTSVDELLELARTRFGFDVDGVD